MAKKFVFTVSSGRCGTVYLTELLKQNVSNATVYHERVGYLGMGIHSPDASHFTQFNTLGNVQHVQDFWQQKFDRDATVETDWYMEVSHFLCKAGLLENINMLEDKNAEIYIINLSRDVYPTAWSFINHFDFMNNGFTWLFALDPNYPNKIVDAGPLMQYNLIGKVIWYILEMQTRAEYYKLLLADRPSIHFIDARLEDISKPEGAMDMLEQLLGDKPMKLVMPEKKNQTKHEFFPAEVKQNTLQLVSKLDFDPKAIAKDYFSKGLRLASPPVQVVNDPEQAQNNT